MNSKDTLILEKMIEYCEQIAQTCMMFEPTHESFLENHVFQNACSMCLFQIGELSGRLSEQTKEQMKDIAWKDIRGIRNIFAHNYIDIDVDITWHTITDDIPALKARCQEALREQQE